MSDASDEANNEEGLPSITMSRTTRLWAVVTEKLREELAAEYQQAIDNVEEELKEIDSSATRMVTNLYRTNPQQAMAVRQQVEVEKRRRERIRERLRAHKKQAEELELGSEYLRGTVETLAEVKPGDNLSGLMCGVELLTKDGVVQKIRKVDPETADTKAAEFEDRMAAITAGESAAEDKASRETPSSSRIITPGGVQPTQDSPLRLASDGEGPTGGPVRDK
ncbi:MAG: YlqD family protein [Armatimonadota bacterium]